MKQRAVLVAIAGLAVLPLPAATAGGGGDDDRDRTRAGLREFEGTVTSVNRERRRFRLLRSNGKPVTLIVRRTTTFEDIDGFRQIRRGLPGVQVDASRSRGGRWIARHVELTGRDRDNDDDDDNSGPG
jgi:hypothetical protein